LVAFFLSSPFLFFGFSVSLSPPFVDLSFTFSALSLVVLPFLPFAPPTARLLCGPLFLPPFSFGSFFFLHLFVAFG